MPLTLQKLVSRLSLRQLQVFQAVYREQGYSKAANRLGLTQPAVSSQIRHLEEALGQPLFEYVGRKLYSTAAGEVVAANIDAIFQQLNKLQNDMHALVGQVAGDLRLVAVNTAQYVVPHLLKPFLQQHPGINVKVQVVNRARAIGCLDANSDDLVIMGLVPSEKPLASLPFLDNELIPALPPEHPLARQAKVSPQAFLDQPLLLREPGSGSRLALEQHCQQQRLRIQPYMELGSNDAVKHAVLAGLGVAVLPRLSILPELRLGLLQTLPLKGFPLRRSWCLVHPLAKHPTPATRAFLAYVQEHLKEINDYFAQLTGSRRD